ncbi:hypothetical protein L6R50_03160 [Myxococcota bacterium]|nr:hypothetical protein [Myxococcota bacterium]
MRESQEPEFDPDRCFREVRTRVPAWLPPVGRLSLRRDVTRETLGGLAVDAELQLDAGARPVTLSFLFRKDVDQDLVDWLGRIQLAGDAERERWVVVTERCPRQARHDLRERGLGYLDLHGNAFIQVPGLATIYHQSQWSPAPPPGLSERSVVGGDLRVTATWLEVSVVLLLSAWQERGMPDVATLARLLERSPLAIGWAYRELASLGYVTWAGSGAPPGLEDPARLLDDLVEAARFRRLLQRHSRGYRFADHVSVDELTVTSLEFPAGESGSSTPTGAQLVHAGLSGRVPFAFGGQTAARRLLGVGGTPDLLVYVPADQVLRARDVLRLEDPGPRAPHVRLARPFASPLWSIDGFTTSPAGAARPACPVLNPVQVVLDLAQSDADRDRRAAARLRERLLGY